jgi:Ca2+-binding RTX toxin-like protein
MTLPLDPNDLANGYFYGAANEYMLGSIAAVAGGTPIGKAVNILQLTAAVDDTKDKIVAVHDDPNLTNTMQLAISILFLFNLGRGNPFVTEMPMTVAQAWHYVFDVPDEYVTNFTTKEAFWAQLQSQFPNDFFLDEGGQLIEPLFISYPPETADWSQPFAPFIPGAAAPDVYNDVQPGLASAVTTASPLVIDLSASHTGVTLTSWNASTTETYFDLNDNGFAVQTAWVSGDTGLLARDLNSDGEISSSAELFGSPTVDGFAKLAALDSNHDLRIDNNDDAWSSLVVWTDSNGDAVTESGELHSLASLNIASIDLAGIASSTSTISGNPISHVSTVRFTSGATAAIDDAWFVHDNTNSYYTGAVTFDTDVIALPALRGYGTLPELQLAMSLDSDLKDLVSDFTENFTLESFADPDELNDAVTEILYTWGGVTGVSEGSRGPDVDSQHLGFLERLVGSEFLQYGTNPIPLPTAGLILEQTYQTAYNMLFSNLLVQAGAAALFEGSVSYNPATGMLDGDLTLSEDAIDGLVGIAPSPGAANNAFWVAIGRFLEGAVGLDNLSGTELTWLDDAVNDTDSSLHWVNTATIVAAEINGSGTDDTLTGDSNPNTIHGYDGNDILNGADGADTLYGENGHDIIHGGAGNDTLYGGDGNDTIYAEGGNNILYGGGGGNFLGGYTGNDTYYYGGGDDLIDDPSGTDQIILPSGITLGDLTISRVSTDNSLSYFTDLLISIDGGGSIQIHGQFASSVVETLVFYDTSTLNLATLAPDVLLTNGNDSFSGTGNASYAVYGFAGNDSISTSGTGAHTLDGGNGNDALTGGSSSNDTYIASTGFDTISENYGTDSIVVPVGFTLDDVTFYRIIDGGGPTNHLGILIEGLGQIKVTSHFSSSAYAVESMHFLEDSSTISLTSLDITTLGTAGNDTLYAPTANASANDIIDGREGNDSLNGGAGDDTYIFSAGHDTVHETSGDDTIRVRDSYTTSDITLFFDDSNNLQMIDSDGNNMTVYRQSYSAAYGVEHIAFGSSTVWDLDTIEVETHGTSSGDYLYGADYGDASTADTIYGYDGNDNLRGGAGNDTIYGGDGADYIYASGSDGSDTAHGNDGADTLYGVGHSVLYGDDGNDSLNNNASSGNAATTVVTLYGGSGVDTLWGGYGQTIMDGGSGADSLNGISSSTETFKFGSDAFGAVDTVNYFRTADSDKLDISDILDGHYTPGVDVITNFVQIQTNGSNSELYVDTTGSASFGSVQHIATIVSVTGLTDEAALVTAGTLLAA